MQNGGLINHSRLNGPHPICHLFMQTTSDSHTHTHTHAHTHTNTHTLAHTHTDEHRACWHHVNNKTRLSCAGFECLHDIAVLAAQVCEEMSVESVDTAAVELDVVRSADTIDAFLLSHTPVENTLVCAHTSVENIGMYGAHMSQCRCVVLQAALFADSRTCSQTDKTITFSTE